MPVIKTYISQSKQQSEKRVGHIIDINFSEEIQPDGKIAFICIACQRPFGAKRWLRKHIEDIHSKSSLQECRICEFTTNSIIHMYEHNSTEHINIRYSCDKCDSRLTSERNLEAHKTTRHSTERTFICSICCYSFTKKKSLKNHEERVHSTTTVECPECSKSFTHEAHLKTHLRYHNDAQQLKCEHCGKGFVSGQKLSEHINTHTGEKPYNCKSQDCAAALGHPVPYHIIKSHVQLLDNLLQYIS